MTKTSLVFRIGLSGCLVNECVWIVEDELACGTFKEYVQCVANAHYAGHFVSPWLWVLTGGSLNKMQPERKQGPWDNDYASVTFTLNGETYGYTIDGRA
jgi:hypothetical protein